MRQADTHVIVCPDVGRTGGTVHFLSCLSWFVCFCFFLSAAERVRQADTHERICPDVRRAGGTVNGCLFFGSAPPVVFIFLFCLFLGLQHRRRATRTEIGFVHYLYTISINFVLCLPGKALAPHHEIKHFLNSAGPALLRDI